MEIMIIGRSARYASLVLRTTSGLVPKVSPTPARCLCHWDTRRQHDTNSRWKIIGSKSFLSTPNSISSQIVVKNLFPNNGAIVGAFSSNVPPIKEAQSNKEAQPSKETQPSQEAQPSKEEDPIIPTTEKQTIFQKMKQLTKDYWHILIPVHVVTSIGWVSIFYIAAKNGVDVVRIMEYLNLGERYLDLMRGSNAGHWAVTYALYKLATPVRYTVTVGGTTMSIRYLNKMGYLKFKPRSTIKETQSSKCAAPDQREKYAKTEFKDQQQTEPPKT